MSLLFVNIGLVNLFVLLAHGIYLESLAANYGGGNAKSSISSEYAILPATPLIAGICQFYPLSINGKLYPSSSSLWNIVDDSYLSALFCKYNITHGNPINKSALLRHLLSTCNKLYSSPTKSQPYKHVVPFIESISISWWCSTGHSSDTNKSCNIPTETHSTIPYLCIGNDFPSMPLDVPADCHFAHQSLSECSTYDQLRLMAIKKCQITQQLTLHAFEPIFPCDDQGRGKSVELDYRAAQFVCCPQALTIAKDEEKEEDSQHVKVNELVNELKRDKLALRDLWWSKEASNEISNLENDLDEKFEQTYINEQENYATDKLRPFMEQQRVLADRFAKDELRMRHMVDYVLQEPYPNPLRKTEAFHEYLSVIKHRLKNISSTFKQVNYSNELLLTMARDELLRQVNNVSSSLDLLQSKLLEQDPNLFNGSLILKEIENIVTETNHLLTSGGKEKTFLFEQAQELLERASTFERNVPDLRESTINSTEVNFGIPVLRVSSLATLAIFNVLLILLIVLFLASRSHFMSCIATKHKTNMNSRSSHSQYPTCHPPPGPPLVISTNIHSSSLTNNENSHLETSQLLQSAPPRQDQRPVAPGGTSIPYSWMKRFLLVTTIGTKRDKFIACPSKSDHKVRTTTRLIEAPHPSTPEDERRDGEGFENPVFQFYERRNHLQPNSP